MTLNVIVIDDSKMQRLLTCKLVNEHQNLNCVGAFGNPKEGLKAVNDLRPDVLILDVEMPELDGFGVLEYLEFDCQVILYSTRATFAFNAFNYEQVKDFVTKPLGESRFEKSVDKILNNYLMESSNTNNLGTYTFSERLSMAS